MFVDSFVLRVAPETNNLASWESRRYNLLRQTCKERLYISWESPHLAHVRNLFMST